MINNYFYPLRTIVGSSIPILEIQPIRAGTIITHRLHIRQHPNIEGVVLDDVYSNFLPDIICNGITFRPLSGMNTMPVPESSLEVSWMNSLIPLNAAINPPDIPFTNSDQVCSIFGYRDDNFFEMQLNEPSQTEQERINPFHSGRDSTYNFYVLLAEETLVGGICFNGYPFISSRLENTLEGMTVGNFGLPREIRLTPLPPTKSKPPSRNNLIQEFAEFQRSQFIDSEFDYTRQEIISHSGLNYLTIDPVKTNCFILTLTDLPFIPKIIDLDSRRDDDNPLLVKGFTGFAIPYLYFFEYKEQTKRNARLHAGLLGVKPAYPHLPKVDGDSASEDVLRRAFPEYEYVFSPGIKDPGTVTGVITDEKGAAIPSVQIRIKNSSRVATTNESGSFVIAGGVKATDVLVISASGYYVLEIPVRGRAVIDVQLSCPGTDPTPNSKEGFYFVFTAHSSLGQRRKYQLPHLRVPLTECFVSDILQPDEKITLYLQQGEEFKRCVAGLKALFLLIPQDEPTELYFERLVNRYFGVGVPDNQLSEEERTYVEDVLAYLSNLPTEINFCEKIGLRIYEIDPVEGVSPASVDLNSKYATLLVDTVIDSITDVAFSLMFKGIPFKRISSSKYFALELSNKGDKNGQVAIYSLQMVRSAHVSVQPRAARTQQVKAMHYRIIGAELADDFSRLGNEGFNFSIDRLVAGQTKNVLYSAMSLLDLLHTGNARIHSNVRRRSVEFEMIENYQEKTKKYPEQAQADKYQIKKFYGDDFTRLNQDNRTSNGWRRNETGEGVTWNSLQNRPQDFPNSMNESGFESYGTIENRTHNILLFPDTDDTDWGTVSALGNMFKVITDPTRGLQIIIDQLNSGGISDLKTFIDSLLPDGLLIKSYKASNPVNFNKDQLVKDFEREWKGISTLNKNLMVTGIISSSQSPIGISAIAGDALSEIISSLSNLKTIAENIKAILETGDVGRIGDLLKDLGGLLDLLILFGTLSATSAGGGVSPLAMIPLLNGLTLGLTSGVGVNIGSGPNLIFPSYQMTANSGSTGSINKSASKTGYSYNQSLNVGYDNSILGDSEIKRVVNRRELLGKDNERIRGAEVMWQDKIQDIVTGTISLNFTLPATATKMNFRTADETLRVRFNSGFSPSVEVDFWFELTEETIRDDY